MCVQNFIHSVCGHIVIQQDLCNEALAMDLPLLIVAACPHYQIHSRLEYRLCGEDSVHCAEILDGKYMYDLQHALQVAEAEEHRNNSEIEGHRAAQARVLQYVSRITGEVSAFNNHPTVVEIWKTVGPLYLKKAHIAARKAYLHALMTGGTKPTDTHARKRQVASPTSPLHSRSKRSRRATDILKTNASPNPARSTVPAVAEPFVQTTPPPRRPTWSQAPSFRTPELMASAAKDRDLATAEQVDSPMERTSRRASKKRKAAEADSSIRRSARVNKKKVNYAESSSSDRASRETSVEEAASDTSFSPPSPPLPKLRKSAPAMTKRPARLRSNASATTALSMGSQARPMRSRAALPPAGDEPGLLGQHFSIVHE